MANVQKQFEKFHENVKLGRFDENQTLRDKRDIVRKKVDERLPAVFEKYGETCPEYKWRDQGSYEMDTGNKPLSGDIDIDQGLYMEVSTSDYDPVTLKKRVHEALDGHTDEVEIRRPCVTVWYHNDGKRIYHVDIAVYSTADKNADGKDRLAVGRTNSSEENRSWDVSNPKELSNKIFDRFKDEDRAQFRREVRYLKRWKDKNFSSNGNAAPTGIALTVAAYHWLTTSYFDMWSNGKTKPNDHKALLNLVRAMLSQFTSVLRGETWVRRLEVRLPVEPWSDLLEQLTDAQMESFEEKLKELRNALEEAETEVDPHEACKRLKEVFGGDFPVPEKKDTARKTVPPIASSSNSG